jgi:hypothetical protein
MPKPRPDAQSIVYNYDPARLATMSEGDLLQLQTAVKEVAAGIDISEPNAVDLLVLNDLHKMSLAVNNELTRRVGTVEARAAAADKLAKSIIAAGTASRDLGDRLGRSGARVPSMRALSAHRPGRVAPRSQSAGGSSTAVATLTAAALPGVTPETEIDVEEWSRAVARQLEVERKAAMGRDSRGDGEKVYLGSIRWAYDEARTLTGDPVADQRKVNDVVSTEALVASGGVCGPVAVDYSVTSVSANDRPVRDALAVFGAARGGLRYILPHTLAMVTADNAVSVWTNATDVSPGANTKPDATFVCQSVQETYVDAVTAIVQFGNFQARYFPEQITQYMETVDAVHSRLADATLLAAISGGTNTSRATASNYEVGACRDFLAELDRAASGYRYRNRIAMDTPLRLIAPAFLVDMIRADLTRNLPGDSGGGVERLGTTLATVESWLNARAINVSWALDSLTTNPSYSGNAVLQGFLPQGSGALNSWPANTAVELFHEGAWVFLDGGELNLGMVRDSTLNKTNDFQMFSESFEKAVFRGHESDELLLKISPLGTTIGTVAATVQSLTGLGS